MSLAKKLNLKPGMKVSVTGKPADVDLDDVATTSSGKADGVLVFVKTLADVDARAAPAVDAAKADRIILWKHLRKQGVQPVRQVALTDVWSALRFRPRG